MSFETFEYNGCLSHFAVLAHEQDVWSDVLIPTFSLISCLSWISFDFDASGFLSWIVSRISDYMFFTQ